jgi:transposase-like protein
MMTKLAKPATRTQLARQYGVSPETMKKWLIQIPDLGLNQATRVLTPKQVETIWLHLGEPDG